MQNNPQTQSSPPMPIAAPSASLYDQDLSAWAAHNANLLRKGQFKDLDIEHLIEELDDMGKSEFRAFESHIQNLLMHLLKWQMQPLMRSGSWRGTIDNARHAMVKLLRDNPSFKSRLQQTIAEEYPYARKSASYETGLALSAFSASCTYSSDQLLDEEWFP